MRNDFIEHLRTYLDEDEVNGIVNSNSKTIKKAILIDKEKITPQELMDLYPELIPHPFCEDAYIYDEGKYDLGKSLLFEIGAFYILEPCSLIGISLLEPKQDDIVLDCCASPGGKSIHCSLKMNNKGFIVSNELSYSRAGILSSNVEKYGRKNIVVTNNDLLDISETYNNCFTKIILDAPCSGSGMFRKEKKMEEDWSLNKVLTLSSLQKELILKAYDLLAPGGTMVYSTCSFSYQEDEEVILHLLKNTSATLLPIFDDSRFFRLLKGTIHLFPHRFDGEGHFYALIRKPISDSERRSLSRKKNANASLDLINEQYLETNGNQYNLISENYNVDKFKIVRRGLKVGLNDKKLGFIPDYAYSRYINNALPKVEVTYEEAISYIAGNPLKKEFKNGYCFLTYKNIPFAFSKVSNNIFKNHYPKGLRKKIL